MAIIVSNILPFIWRVAKKVGDKGGAFEIIFWSTRTHVQLDFVFLQPDLDATMNRVSTLSPVYMGFSVITALFLVTVNVTTGNSP